jgi:hypothetical protein
MTRDLKFHAELADTDDKVCTIYITYEGRQISNVVSGVKLKGVADFFMRNRQAMPSTVPMDFTLWVATNGNESVCVSDDPPIYKELGLIVEESL